MTKNSLLTDVEDYFDAKSRRRGETYFIEDRVDIELYDPPEIKASVFGHGGTYRVEVLLERGGRIADVACSCPAMQKFGPCKHMWATLLMIDNQAVDGAPHVAPWRLTLQNYSRRNVRPTSPSPSPIAEVPALLYVVEESDSDTEIYVEIAHRRRRKNGTLGTLRRTSCADVDHFATPIDREIVSALTGSASRHRHLRSNWAFYHLAAAVFRYILPRLAETGHLYLRTESGVLHGPLEFDPSAWQADLILDEAKDDLHPRLQLSREDDTFPPEQVVSWLPDGLFAGAASFHLMEPSSAGTSAKWLCECPNTVIPVEDAPDLIEELDTLGVANIVRFPTWSEKSASPDAMTKRVVLSKNKFYGGIEYFGKVTFDYGSGMQREAAARSLPIIVDPDAKTWQRNDRDAGARALAELYEAGASPAKIHDVDIKIAASEINGFMVELTRCGWEIEGEGPEIRTATGSRYSVQSTVDWFDLAGGVEFGDQVVPLPRLLEALRAKTSAVALDDGSLGVLPAEWFARRNLLDLAEATPDGLRFGHNQGLLLDLLLSEFSNVDVDKKFEGMRRRLTAFDGIKAVTEPRGFRGELRPYQRDGLGWLRFLEEFSFSGCLADDMGLGKTVQVLAYLLSRKTRQRSGQGTTLVVAPRSVVSNWAAEAARFAPKMSIVDYRGPERKALREDLLDHDIVLTTYGLLRRDIPFLKDLDFGCVVLDEAHAIKNGQSQTAKAARLLRAQIRLALTGTPIENSLDELWSLFEFLEPGLLGRSRAFRDLTKGDDATAAAGHAAVSRTIAPFLLRRTKEQVATDLPDKTEQTLTCSLGREQRKLYDELLAHYRALVLGKVDEVGLGRAKMHVLEALLRLRQAACHPGLIDNKFDDIEAAKLELLLPRLEELVADGRKALVFSQFTKLLARVRKRLDAAKIPYEYLDGRSRKRSEKVERFQTDAACPLFLISLKAGGLGLNLTAAEYVFLLDPWWNPAVEAQAVDRAYRIGQTKNVFAYRVIAEDTIEDKILELQAQKRELAESIVRADSAVMKSLTREDLEQLLA